MPAVGDDDAVAVLGDIGSTFIKLIGVRSEGRVVGRVKVATTHDDIAGGVERAHAALAEQLGTPVRAHQRVLSSSAGGGLRVVVIGLERSLTLEAGRRVSATAGARIVAAYADAEIGEETPEGFLGRRPDLALLTGGTNGGDSDSIVRSAAALQRLAPSLPVVVAGNEAAHARVRDVLGNGRSIQFVSNVMPHVGQLDGDAAQRAIREVFIEQVMGHGRYASASSLARSVLMPTPAAVLGAAETVAQMGAARTDLARPVIVDVGGATTDVHSVIPCAGAFRGYATSVVPDQIVTRTVEGDLGLRENAETLVQVAIEEGYVEDEELTALRSGAERRRAEPAFVSQDCAERQIDERLATLATAVALHRHAGVLRTTLTPAGAALRRTGRDLREATCLIVTGGIFEHTSRATELAADALRQVHARGGLVAASLPVFRDRLYLLWAVGLMRRERPESASRMAAATLAGSPPR